jgi:preprotein translocase subunit SecY
MPIIFASSLMVFPSVVFSAVADGARASGSTGWYVGLTNWLATNFQTGAYLYVMLYVAMVYFFSYFWITVQFNPEDMSKQLRDHGSFIPGLRPGPRTAEYLEAVMERITYVGAAFLAVIAVLPMVVNQCLNRWTSWSPSSSAAPAFSSWCPSRSTSSNASRPTS